ncbi:MAG: hypothetical protein AAFV53_13380 [Myxococcota bacterium]
MLLSLLVLSAHADPGDIDVPALRSRLTVSASVTEDDGRIGSLVTPQLYVDTRIIRLGLSASAQRDWINTNNVDVDPSDPLSLLEADLSNLSTVDEWEYVGDRGLAGAISAVEYLWVEDPSDRFSLRVDDFSAITLGRGTVLSRYNPHLLTPGMTSGQGHVDLGIGSADLWVEDITDPMSRAGAAVTGQLPLGLAVSGQWLSEEIVGAEISYAPLQTERLHVESYVAYDQQMASGSSTSIGASMQMNTGEKRRGVFTADVCGLGLTGGFNPIAYATLPDAFASAEAGSFGARTEIGFAIGDGPGVSLAGTFAGDARRAELTTTLPLSDRFSVAGTAISDGTQVAGAARMRVQPMKFLNIEAGSTIAADSTVGWETSAGLNIPLGGKTR